MIEHINGSCLSFEFEANELTNHTYSYRLPDGYSLKTVRISLTSNITYITTWTAVTNGSIITFPVVNSHSPAILKFYIQDLTKSARIYIDIMEFGQIPDINYFDKAFDPILVTGEDGNEYNVIPSDQFK